MANSAAPSVSVAVAREGAAHRELFDVVLEVLEERCTSFALDDADDRRHAAYAIADELQRRGVTS